MTPLPHARRGYDRRTRQIPYRARCAVRGCAGAQRKGFPVCAGHWAQVPDDLQLRLKLARDEEDTEWNAAVAAVIESVEDLPGSAVDTDDND